MLSKKAQVQVFILFGIMMAVFAFITAVILIDPLKDLIVDARDAASLDCTNTSISTGVASTCLIVDLYLPLFIGTVIVVGLGWIFARRISSG